MSDAEQKPAGGCACGGSGCCRHKPVPEASGLTGWPFVLRCTAVFLVPLAAAIAGASWAGPGRVGQAVGAVVGLVLGVTGVRLALRPRAVRRA